MVKTKESKSGLALAALAMTPARWYSPTRHSKKLAFPSRLIISIQSKGLRSLYSLLYLGGAQAEGKAKLTGELCVQGKSAPHPLSAPQGHALAPAPNARHPHLPLHPDTTHSPQGNQQSVRTELDVGVHKIGVHTNQRDAQCRTAELHLELHRLVHNLHGRQHKDRS